MNISEIHFDTTKNITALKQFIYNNISDVSNATYILASSLPPRTPGFRLSSLLSSIGINGGSQIVIGDNCCALIDALIYCSRLPPSIEPICILCYDSFSQYFSDNALTVKPGAKDWNDCLSAVIIDSNTKYKISIRNNCKIHDNSFWDLLQFDAAGKFIPNQERAAQFTGADLSNELTIINRLCKLEKTCIDDYDSLILVNREAPRTQALIDSIGISKSKAFSSRNEIGHTGCSDILYNMRKAIECSNKKQVNMLISSNGLGYSWSGLTACIEKP